MKKYFIKGTDKEAKFGTNFTLRGTIDEDNIDFLKHNGVVEERLVPEDDDEEEEEWEDCEYAEVIDFLLSSNERLERTVRTLEKKIDSLKTTVASIVKCCHNG